MENTEELDINDIGALLKSSRLKSKKSMEEISGELCIRKIYLTALEEGDYETLPPIPYGIGYVRTYARYLGLNPERAVKLYKAASTVQEPVAEDEIPQPETDKSNSRHVLAGVLILVLIYGVWLFYSLPEKQITVPQKNIAEEVVPASPVISEDYVQAEEQLDEVATETNQEDIVQNNVNGNSNSVEQTPVAEKESVNLEDKAEETQPGVESNVVLEFLEESWVEIKDKRRTYLQGVFHKGDKKEIAYSDNLFLSVGRPENVKVYIKGEEKNIFSKRRKMNIPLDSLN